MNTLLLPCSKENCESAGKIIRDGGIVAFPTETVYGLGANALDPDAVKSIFEAKGRPQDNPLIVHLSDTSQLPQLIKGGISSTAARLADECWPGPLTMIFPKSNLIPDSVTAGLDSIGIRIPSSEYAQDFLRACGCPIAAPSANRSGKPSPTTARRVFEDMNGKIPLILDGGDCLYGVESTVLDVTGTVPKVLRPGGVSVEEIIEIAGSCEVDDAVMRPLKEGEKPRSPGMKYRHYAPKCPVTVYSGNNAKVVAAIKREYDAHPNAVILAPDSAAGKYGQRRVISLGSGGGDAAHRLFEALRSADDMSADAVLAHSFDTEGIGLAVMNRLGRAAAFRIIEAE